jgi:hypothetical protein
MKTLFLIYWLLTTIAGVYLIIKTPPNRKYQDYEFSLLDVMACIFPCACIAWAVVPMVLLHKVKFKR